MKKTRLSSKIMGLLGLAALVLTAGAPAQAAFVVGGENGWQMTYDGMINVFAVYRTQDNLQDSHGNVSAVNLNNQGFTVRTGLLPSIFAFNVKSPTINGVDYAARIGLYPQIQNYGQRTGFGTHYNGGTTIDIREVFFTADGKFGQVLAGRALNLYQGKNILSDMTLFGVGVPLDMGSGGGTTLGHIGYGYAFPSFNSQFRYTTPDMSGLKVAFAICEPSRISGSSSNGGAMFDATKLNQPRFETEISYAKAYTGGKMTAWLSGMYQEAKSIGLVSMNRKVDSLGGAGGVSASFGPFEATISGYGGRGIGTLFIQDDDFDGNALDGIGNERTSYGGLAQAMYTIGKVKLGAQYGMNYADRTDYETANGYNAHVKSRQAVTGGVYYSVNKYLQLVGEYSWDRTSYYNDLRQTGNTFSLGTIFVW